MTCREVAAGLRPVGEAIVAYPDHPQTLAARDDEAHCLERLAQA
ncbi:hypothetical protein [Streptomyces sp. EN27]|nr:hypothetical protein [Streptomyces sp. EN27]